MDGMFLEIPASLIKEIRSSAERRELDSSGASLIQIAHIVYARKDSTNDWVLRLTTGVDYILDEGAESLLREKLL